MHALNEHVASPHAQMPWVESHCDRSAEVQPPGAVGAIVGIFVGALLGAPVGAFVGGSVGHATWARSLSTAFKSLYSAMM